MTAIAGSVFTAAQFNTFVRDNLAETAPAKATTAGAYFAVSDTNQIAQRVPAQQGFVAPESTTSASYTDLTTPGPTVTVTTGVQALVAVTAEIGNNTGSAAGKVSVEVSGASSIAATDNNALRQESAGGSEFQRCSLVYLQTGLTPGSNTFTMKYITVGGISTFNFRNLLVMPF
jgi:hypothetical protein